MRGKKGSGIDWTNPDERKKARAEYQRKYRKDHPDRVKESQKKWKDKNPENIRKNSKLYYQRHPERCKQRSREWCENNREQTVVLSRRWKQQNPEKVKAHNLLMYAIRKGDIVPQPCEVCHSTNAQGHHADYHKPYEVIWLCPLHHKEIHQTETI